MRAMILAAGRGERLRPLTDDIPKSLVDVGGESLLGRHLRNVQAAGIRTVVINLGWLGNRIIERVGSGERYGLDVIYSDEGDNILETGGGIHKALPHLGDAPFLVVNADIYTDMPVPRVELAAGCLGHLVLVPTPDYRDHGDFDIEDGLIRNGEMLREAADQGLLSGSVYEGLWADVGTPERLAALQGLPKND